MKKTLSVTVAVLAVLGLLSGVRMALEPKETPAPEVDLSDEARERLANLAGESRVDELRLVTELQSIDVLLVGEDHYYVETMAFLTRLLDSVEGRRLALLLELPAALQPHVDAFVATGSSPEFETAVREGEALPFGTILQWAHANRAKLSRVVAMDEGGATIFVNRALLRDTRNATMAAAITEAVKAGPGDLVVAYGGQLHMTLAGRYRYDVDNRTPAGALLLRSGIDRSRIRSVMLTGTNKSPAAGIVPPGVFTTANALGRAEFGYFIDYPIFRAGTAAELFDYYVNLGELTRIPRTR